MYHYIFYVDLQCKSTTLLCFNESYDTSEKTLDNVFLKFSFYLDITKWLGVFTIKFFNDNILSLTNGFEVFYRLLQVFGYSPSKNGQEANTSHQVPILHLTN